MKALNDIASAFTDMLDKKKKAKEKAKEAPKEKASAKSVRKAFNKKLSIDEEE